MRCNAWNHSPDCNCGWGGDTDGGWSDGSWSVADGTIWGASRPATYASFTKPNAHCPICGAEVFFYQSASGGRVFFDELGRPWPKHPCTDDTLVSPATRIFRLFHNPIRAPKGGAAGPNTSPRGEFPGFRAPTLWRSLIPGGPIKTESDWVRIPFFSQDRALGRFLYLPTDWWDGAPVFYRWSPEKLGMIELSTVSVAGPEGTLDTRQLLVPGWLRTDDEHDTWRQRPDAPHPAELWNDLGWFFSFEWRFWTEDSNWTRMFPVGLDLARACFEKGARLGNCDCLNNLAVLYRDGLGISPDQARAFSLFREAAQRLDVVPLEHLRDCYKDGIGCPPDVAMAAFLEDLIAVRKAETGAEDDQGDEEHDFFGGLVEADQE